MKRFFSLLFAFPLFLSVAVLSPVYSKVPGDFIINNFSSQMLLEKDGSLNVTEKIEVEFLTDKQTNTEYFGLFLIHIN